ncbi:hypothetical protein RFI_01164 [Reticulomyxa filosa]|uniref:Uncharacterized protein n=1 Tax=Reticulomyxa filosa TaxID=46433 RepID=X6PBN1_RETFI|nr:hypothetical protein RFI_01164 [Reticulomyxa filosa]|eukprot:ETO35900.1 hypothetical protein RFI_01164 [Reticulomyxa filosa]
MISFKAYVNAGGKSHMIILSELTMKHLKEQVIQVTPKKTDEVLLAIIDGDGCQIETDESVIQAFKKDPVYFTIQVQSEGISKVKENEQLTREKEEIPEPLDFKKHWNKFWRKCNAEASKKVEQMIQSNEQGLIVIAYNTLKWKNRRDNLSSISNLVNSKENDIKEFGVYCMYVIKRRVIILEDIHIDGNIYAIDCELQCKGSVNITTQLFVTKNATIDTTLKQSISAIQWNTKIHHDIPIQFQTLDDEGEKYIELRLFNESAVCWQQYLQIAIDDFGSNHHYVAIAYNLIGNVYCYQRQYNKTIEFYEKVLQILLNVFGTHCNFVAHLYENLGYTYDAITQYEKAIEYHTKALETRVAIFGAKHIDVSFSYDKLGKIYQLKSEYNKAIEYHEKSLQIKLEIFGFNYEGVADSFWTLGIEFERLENYKTACDYFERAWKVYNTLLGEWDSMTLQAKRKAKNVNKRVVRE